MVKVAILGLGARGGYIYSAFAHLRPDLLKITAICDIKRDLVEKYKAEFHVPDDRCFNSAEEMLSAEKLADVMIIATQDKDHYTHAMAALDKGYHLILEKPISPDMGECLAIQRKVKETGRLLAVCHVLRYTAFFREIRRLLNDGAIGTVRGIEQTENVAYWHYAHSFVRGNWRNSDETSPMFLQKCCHDTDILQWLIGAKPVSVSSYGNLGYFKEENAPRGSTYRCIEDCKVKETCPYNAERFYLKAYDSMPEEQRRTNWIFNVLCNNSPSREKMENAMQHSRYGVCAFRCDNNVVDHQTVNILFENGVMATLIMTAYTKDCHRIVRIYGTDGELEADDLNCLIKVRPFIGENYEIDVTTLTDDLSGHGGGDNKMLEEFLTLVDNGGTNADVSSSIENSVISHLMAFAAEKSRLEGGKPVLIEDLSRS